MLYLEIKKERKKMNINFYRGYRPSESYLKYLSQNQNLSDTQLIKLVKMEDIRQQQNMISWLYSVKHNFDCRNTSNPIFVEAYNKKRVIEYKHALEDEINKQNEVLKKLQEELNGM